MNTLVRTCGRRRRSRRGRYIRLRFWGLAQSLSALYPSHTEEKRWIDGVLARKKSLGF